MTRLSTGGRLDRSRTLEFRFDGRSYAGLEGDTLASALLANDVRVVGRSAERGRPRGIFSAGPEEPNALVTVDGRSEPALRATTVELYEGLAAHRLAGKGRVSQPSAHRRYDKVFTHTDVLVIGAGPAGLSAALAAGQAGARVLLVDQRPELGGDVLSSNREIDGRPSDEWVLNSVAELARLPEVRLMSRGTALACYDHNLVLVAERRTEHLGPAALPHIACQRLWHVRSAQVVLATGALERPIVFSHNDLPGVLLAGSVGTYVNRFGVAPGRRAVIFTNNDTPYQLAHDLHVAGVGIAAIVDSRAQPVGQSELTAWMSGVTVFSGHVVMRAVARTDTLEGVIVAPMGPHGPVSDARFSIECDLLAVSGGFDPQLHLLSQTGHRPLFNERLACFTPGTHLSTIRVAGSANGTFELGASIQEGLQAGADAAGAAGFPSEQPPGPSVQAEGVRPIEALWLVPGDEAGWTEHFVDLERDVTVADIQRAVGAGLQSVEHVKRYTAAGTGCDQGKTSTVNTTAILAGLLSKTLDDVGMTACRPPYVPIPFALLVGRERGALYEPVRITSIHEWHVIHGAVFENVGQWKRPHHYPHPGESVGEAVRRECRAVREAAGIVDVCTLGKIDIQGPDALEFLNRVYINSFDSLGVGHCRYGVMCTADGMVFDDGVIMHLAPGRYLATTTTGGAGAVMEWLEEWLQTQWSDLRVRLTSVTDQWATVALAGPRARTVLSEIANDIDVDSVSFPFMAIAEGTMGDVPARVCRVSFSGELAFEISVPSAHGLALWQSLIRVGAPLGLQPYGTEAMHVLRAEMGFVSVGQETDGTATPQDVGLAGMIKNRAFVGARSHRRSHNTRADRMQLVGLVPTNEDDLLIEGAQLILDTETGSPRVVGHVTSSYRNGLGKSFALALVEGGRERVGQRVYSPGPDGFVGASVTAPRFHDREHQRRND